MKKPKRKKATRNTRLGRKAWIRAAREALIKGGIEAVKVERLADDLNAGRAGFYYHFKNRDQLLAALLKDWEINNTRFYEEVLTTATHNGAEELEAINDMWLEETEFDPAYDSAMRDWTRVSPEVAKAVKRVDKRRIGILNRIYRDLGYKDPEALVRARVAYFHQVGYYTLNLGESRKLRRELAPLYLKVLVGR